MKIEWLDDQCTSARLTRGWLWWKKEAYVERVFGLGGVLLWVFRCGEVAPIALRRKLINARDAERRRRTETWVPVRGRERP